jgi:hypothetical protein
MGFFAQFIRLRQPFRASLLEREHFASIPHRAISHVSWSRYEAFSIQTEETPSRRHLIAWRRTRSITSLFYPPMLRTISAAVRHFAPDTLPRWTRLVAAPPPTRRRTPTPRSLPTPLPPRVRRYAHLSARRLGLSPSFPVGDFPHT